MATVCRKHNISPHTFSRWPRKFEGMEVSDARKLKDLESENSRLKRLLAEQFLVIEGLKEFAGKNECPGWSARGDGMPDEPGDFAAQGV